MMDRYHKDSNTSYILGISLIIEALLEVPESVKEVYLSTKANKNIELSKLIELCDKHRINIIYDDSVINKLSLKENCYGIGVFNKFSKPLETKKHIVLYNFSNEGELGTILRSATSFDFKDIVLINSSIDIFDPKVIRASMGSFFHVNLKKYDSLNDYFNDYKYNIYPFTNNGTKELKSISFKEPYSIIIPSNANEFNDSFIESYYIEHKNRDVYITSLSAIVFNYAYHLNLKR